MTRDEYREILEYIRRLIMKTRWEGHVYAVGGCCRDDLMHLPINDIDLAVDIPGGGISFAKWLRRRGKTIGLPVLFERFGTAKLHLKEFPDEEIEVVQTRKEKYTDRNSRNPLVASGDIKEDCERRDLTINTLYYDISNRRGLDLTGKGVEDINNHIIRTPLDPDITFDDDPVRILRTIRFACRFGWDIEENTFEALCRNAHRVQIVSAPRAQAELTKMLMSDNPVRAMELLRDSGAMRYFIPELCDTYDKRYKGTTVWEHQIRMLEASPFDLSFRLAALMHDIGIPHSKIQKVREKREYINHDTIGTHIAAKVLKRMGFPKKITEDVMFLISNHHRLAGCGDNAERLSKEKLGRLRSQCRGRKRFNRLLDFIDLNNKSYPPEEALPHQIEAVRKML